MRPPWTWARVRTVLAVLLVGERPPGPSRPHRARAPRARLSGLTVDPSGIAWRTWWGRRGWIAVGDVDRVALLTCEHWGSPTSIQHSYALVLDRESGVLLRVAASDDARRRSTFDPLGVQVEHVSTAFRQAKGYRRRWPEAFGWVHAHTVLTSLGLCGVYVLLVAIAEGRLGG